MIAIKLDKLLLDRRVTLTEVARRVGITLPNLSLLKSGKTKEIRFALLDALCRELGCQPGDLLAHEAAAAGGVGPEPAGACVPGATPGLEFID